MSEPGMHRIH